MINYILLQIPQRIGNPLLGIILPGIILALSFLLTLMLIRFIEREQKK